MTKPVRLLTCLLWVSLPLCAEVAVVVHPGNNAQLDAGYVAKIFLGKAKSFPNGSEVVPINQKGTATDDFNKNVLRKSASQLKAYWTKLVFTGKGTPPTLVANDAEVVKLVTSNPNMIGYIDASAVSEQVRVIGTY